MHAVLEFVKRDSSAVVMRVVETNAVLRFLSRDNCLNDVGVGARVAVDALTYDNNIKVVTCRCAAEEKKNRVKRVLEEDVDRASKRGCA